VFEKFKNIFGRYIVKEITGKVGIVSTKDDRCVKVMVTGEDGGEQWMTAWKNAVSESEVATLLSAGKGDTITVGVEQTAKGFINIISVKNVEHTGEPQQPKKQSSGGGYYKSGGGGRQAPKESPEDKHRAFALSYAKDVAIAVANITGSDPAGVPRALELLGYENIITIAKAFAEYLDTGE